MICDLIPLAIFVSSVASSTKTEPVQSSQKTITTSIDESQGVLHDLGSDFKFLNYMKDLSAFDRGTANFEKIPEEHEGDSNSDSDTDIDTYIYTDTETETATETETGSGSGSGSGSGNGSGSGSGSGSGTDTQDEYTYDGFDNHKDSEGVI